MPRLEQPVATAAEMEALGAKLASRLGNARVIYVHGPLGAGKTTLVRGMLRAFGHEGTVKSPTFTLVEPYDLKDISFYHFDLYRLNDETEIEDLGLLEYLYGTGLSVIEWPDRLGSLMPEERLHIDLGMVNETARRAEITAHGKAWQEKIAAMQTYQEWQRSSSNG